MRELHYKLLGKIAVPCKGLMEWARWFETAERIVAKTEIGPMHVSTVFIGIDHNFGHSGDPLLFETMIFDDHEDGYQERYSTWGEAEAGHARAVELAEERLAKAKVILGDPMKVKEDKEC